MSQEQGDRMARWRVLLERYSEGDAGALDDIFSEYYSIVIFLCREHYLKRMSHEDLAHSVFESLLENKLVTQGSEKGKRRWDTVDPRDPDGLKTLLCKSIVRHHCRHRKSAARRPEVHMSVLAEGTQRNFDVPESSRGQRELASLTATLHEVVGAIDALPDPEKKVVRLHILDGQTQAIVAETLGVSTQTIRRRLRSACLRLNTRLEG